LNVVNSYKKKDIKQEGIHHRDTEAQSMLRLLDFFPSPQECCAHPDARNDWPEENT